MSDFCGENEGEDRSCDYDDSNLNWSPERERDEDLMQVKEDDDDLQDGDIDIFVDNMEAEDGEPEQEQEEEGEEKEEEEESPKTIEKKAQISNNNSYNNSPFRKRNRIIIHIGYTKYDVIKDVAKNEFKFKTTRDDEADWDLLWVDIGIISDRLAKLAPHQKINHFPGMYSLARKNNLARNLSRMRKIFPKEYRFFPPTWQLPSEWSEFRAQFNRKKAKTFIVKPEASCQGIGIFLTRNYEDIPFGEHLVAQRYLHKPYLIDGLKFDLRIYVLLYGCNPLRIFMFKEGLARFSTEKYISPLNSNLNNLFMHLTNYAINKNSENFVFNEDADNAHYGHKRSLESIWEHIDANGGDSGKVIKTIQKSIIKTLCSAQPTLAHLYSTAQPNDFDNDSCFEILG
jgi:tubulin polyglutamylase TTLL6/13